MYSYRSHFVAAALGAAILVTSPASATIFTGSLLNTNPPAAAGGRCSPAALTVSIGPSLGVSSGSSNLGTFSADMSHCINPPLPTGYSNGLFAFDFGAGDILSGTYGGTLSGTDTAGVFANLENYLVTGGTGQFAGVVGSLTGVGTVTFAAGVPPTSRQTITGSFSVPVPEPSTWAMMLAGFGALGANLRFRRHAALRRFAVR